MSWEKTLERWVGAGLIDALSAERIRQFEKESSRGGLRWPAILAIVFGVIMLCAGILLFVAAHWDQYSPAERFTHVVVAVAVFHLAGGLLGTKVPSMGVGLHLAGTIVLGAGIFLAGQIFNLEEHWPGGVMLWALGAVLAWVVLRQWPQALLAGLLIPAWLGSEWSLKTEHNLGSWNIAAQGFLLLSVLYFSVPQKDSNRQLRAGMMWVGSLALIPFLQDVFWSGVSDWQWREYPPLPVGVKTLGYLVAYVPVLAIAAWVRKKASWPIFVAAAWIFWLGIFCQQRPEHNPLPYLWVAVGACALCWWGVRDNRKLFINFGCAIFALNVIIFYFSDVLDKLGRSMGLILLGVIFLGGGWVLNRLRGGLIARASAAGGKP